MPRVMLNVSETWYKRFQEGVTNVIETLDGIDHRIVKAFYEGTLDEQQLLDNIHSELNNLKRQVETWRLPF